MTNRSPFRYFKTSPEIIRLGVMMFIRFQLSLRNVENLLHERGIDISLSYAGRGSWGIWEPLPALPFMAGSGGGWIVSSWVFEDRFVV